MELSKAEGLKMLKLLGLPTVEQIDPNLLDENSHVLKQGLSVRTSPKRDALDNTSLPSIHNCTDLNELRNFIKKHRNEYNIIVHKTVHPNPIGSISRYGIGTDNLVIEDFEDFEKRKHGITKNRMIVPVLGEKYMISQLQMQKNDVDDFQLFSKVLKEIRHLPFKTFDMEFVAEDGKIVFTDLTIKSKEDREYAQELAKKAQEKENRKKKIQMEKTF